MSEEHSVRQYNTLPMCEESQGMWEQSVCSKDVGDTDVKYEMVKYVFIKPYDESVKNTIIFVYNKSENNNSDDKEPIFILKIVNYVQRPIIDGEEYKPDFTKQEDYEKYHPRIEFTYNEGLTGDEDNTTRLYPHYTGEPSYYCLFIDGKFLVAYPGEVWRPTEYEMFYKDKPYYNAKSLTKDEFDAIEKTNYVFTIND